MIQEQRESGAGVVLLDAGGFVGTQTSTYEPRGMFLVEMMKELDYDAFTLGETEVVLGRDLFRVIAADTTLPLVSANLRDKITGELLLPAFRIVRRNGARVGITAVSMRKPETFLEVGVRCADPVESVAAILPALRERSDVVVLLARMSLPEARKLSEGVKELIDVVVVGNGVAGRGEVGPEDGGSVYVQCGNRGQELGVARVYFPAGDEPLRILADELMLDRDVPEDEDTRKIVDEFNTNLNDSLARESVIKVAQGASSDGEYYLGAENCKECHPREFDLWRETPHADAFNTLILAQSEALPECFRCHVTGTSEDAGYDPTAEGSDRLINVQCEVCHDKGSRHSRDGSYGKSLLMESCVRCHNAEHSPDYDPVTYWLMMEH